MQYVLHTCQLAGWLGGCKLMCVRVRLRNLRPHCNVVQFLGYMKGPGSSLSLVCEYLSHGNLANHLRSFAKMGRFTPHKTVVKLAADTAAGMYHLHCEGILHRGAFVVGEPCERGERVRVSDHDLRGSLACAFVWKQISQRGICWYVQALMCRVRV